MINLNSLSPFLRFAMYSKLNGPFCLQRRTIFDYELILIADGEFCLSYDDSTFKCEKNSVILLRPGHSHQFDILSGKYIFQPHIHFDMTYDENSEAIPVSFKDIDTFSDKEREMIRPDIFSGCKTSSPLLNISDIEYFKRIFFDVIDTFNLKRPLYPLICKRQMLKVLYYIISENFSEMVTPSLNVTEITNGNLQMIKEFIIHNAEKQLTLQSIASYFNYNACYLDRIFKNTYGSSIIKFYHTTKIDIAQERLLQNQSITDIADALSFSSIYSFSRFFKTQTGLSPSEFKKSQNLP